MAHPVHHHGRALQLPLRHHRLVTAATRSAPWRQMSLALLHLGRGRRPRRRQLRILRLGRRPRPVPDRCRHDNATANAVGGITSVRIQRATAGSTTWTDICTDSSPRTPAASTPQRRRRPLRPASRAARRCRQDHDVSDGLGPPRRQQPGPSGRHAGLNGGGTAGDSTTATRWPTPTARKSRRPRDPGWNGSARRSPGLRDGNLAVSELGDSSTSSVAAPSTSAPSCSTPTSSGRTRPRLQRDHDPDHGDGRGSTVRWSRSSSAPWRAAAGCGPLHRP